MFFFIGVFYVSITSSKLIMAIALGSVRRSLNWQIIIWINRLLGVAMFCFAASFFWKGVKILFAL
jgi:small neutral amino acid transporter SnatA (MarC family)